MESNAQELQQQIDELKSKFDLFVNDTDNLFYQILAMRASRKSIEEIVEHTVIQHFKVSRRDFIGTNYAKEGKPKGKQVPANTNVIEARKWFVSIMTNILLKSPFTLRIAYPFYNNIMEIRHRPIYQGAIIPKTEADRKNNKLLRELNDRIKEACLQEGLLEQMKEYAFL